MSGSSDKSRSATCPQCGAPVTLPDYADLAVCPFCGSNLSRELPRREHEWRPLRREMEGDPFTAGGDPGAAQPGGGAPATQHGGLPTQNGARSVAEEQVLHSVSCPQCAGPLSVQAGRRILLCDHCGVRVLVTGGGGLSRWLFPQKIDQSASARRSRHVAHGVSGDRAAGPRGLGDAGAARARTHLGAQCLIAGWEFGTKLRTRYHLVADEEGTERLDLALWRRSPSKSPHLQERRYFQAACDVSALGATRPRFSGRELLLPLVAGEVDPSSTVMEPQGTAAEIVERGRKLALLPASGAADPQTRMLVLRESVTLLYYPLWLVDYQAGGRPYRIVVDAQNGGVNSAGAPAREGRLTPSLGLRMAALVAVAVFALWLGSVVDAVRVPTVFVAVIVCVAAILLVLRSPAGGKVEYHEPFSS